MYIVKRTDDAYLLERRPDKGLLPGMLGWPTSEWSQNPDESPPIVSEWKTYRTKIRHTFTHFHLEITLKTAFVNLNCKPKKGFFALVGEFNSNELPTVFKKAFDVHQEA